MLFSKKRFLGGMNDQEKTQYAPAFLAFINASRGIWDACRRPDRGLSICPVWHFKGHEHRKKTNLVTGKGSRGISRWDEKKDGGELKGKKTLP
ncbi:MAG: hypothetical protein J5846_06345 [Desulfovibrio sp.]|nr:hypothetical protein [Desulfovibrio sp.]